MPGHAAGWTKGKPEIMADCFEKYSYNINDFALNPTLSETYATIAGVLHDIAVVDHHHHHDVHDVHIENVTKSSSSSSTSYLHLGNNSLSHKAMIMMLMMIVIMVIVHAIFMIVSRGWVIM